MLREHFVYYLRDESNVIAYVGRSWNPVRRLKDANKRYAELLTLDLGASFKDIYLACEEERREIRRLNPRLNKFVTSSTSSFGMKFVKSKEAREKIHKAKLGKSRPPFSAEWRANLSRSHLGNTALLGFKFSKESRMKLTAARKGVPRGVYASKNSDRKELLQSGYGHPWRLQNLDERTRLQIG